MAADRLERVRLKAGIPVRKQLRAQERAGSNGNGWKGGYRSSGEEPITDRIVGLRVREPS